MKIALYIEDGLEQIVLTPESAVERGLLMKLKDDDRQLSIHVGSFFVCNGGWVRYNSLGSPRNADDESLLIVLRRKPPPVEEGFAAVDPTTGKPFEPL